MAFVAVTKIICAATVHPHGCNKNESEEFALAQFLRLPHLLLTLLLHNVDMNLVNLLCLFHLLLSSEVFVVEVGLFVHLYPKFFNVIQMELPLHCIFGGH